MARGIWVNSLGVGVFIEESSMWLKLALSCWAQKILLPLRPERL